MKQTTIAMHRFGGPEVLCRETTAIAEPGPGEVRLRVTHAGVSATDVEIRRGAYPFRLTFPLVPGYDVVGTVDALGEGVTSPAMGTRVAALTEQGGYAEYVCTLARDVVEAPAEVDSAEAVTLVLNYTTAYQMLHRVARVRPGQTVLIYGATGGVGSALTELALAAGLRVLATARGSRGDDLAARGVETIDRTKHDVPARVRELAPEGIDAVFEGRAERWLDNYRLLARGGHLVAYGLGADQPSRLRFFARLIPRMLGLALLWAWPDGRSAHFYGIRPSKKGNPAAFRADLAELLGRLAKGQLSPRVADRIPLERAAEAHARLERGDVVGKLVLSCLPTSG